jgi:hypothetical protein
MMTSTGLFRLSGLASIVGGIFIILARVLQVLLFGDAPLSVQAASPLFLPALGVPGLLGSLGFLIGLIGLYARQAERTGAIGAVVFAIAFVGIALSLGANWGYAFMAPYLQGQDPGLLDTGFAESGWGVLGAGFAYSYLAGGLGWLLMGIITTTAGVLPRWVGLMIVASILLPALAPLEIHGIGGILVNLILSAGPMAVGYVLWRGGADSPSNLRAT